jgi:septal ring factor EnvC (AmiA/AmiB activator)
MLDEEDDDGAPAKPSLPVGKPKFSLALGGLGAGGKPAKVPGLDFSNLKHVKENDWYAQCKKLEDVIAKLRARVDTYEAEKSDIVSNNQAQEKLLRQLQRQIVNLRDSNERLLSKNKELLDKVQDFERKEKHEELKG